MFWNKKRKTSTLKTTESVKLSNIESSICHAKYANLDIRRAVLDWRDNHIENVELHLTRELSNTARWMNKLTKCRSATLSNKKIMARTILIQSIRSG